MNSANNAAASNPFEYAEGLALSSDSGVLFGHAWCARDGVAVDPTLRDPMRYEHLGIIVPTKLLRRLQNTKQVFDVLSYQAGQDSMQRRD